MKSLYNLELVAVGSVLDDPSGSTNLHLWFHCSLGAQLFWEAGLEMVRILIIHTIGLALTLEFNKESLQRPDVREYIFAASCVSNHSTLDWKDILGAQSSPLPLQVTK